MENILGVMEAEQNMAKAWFDKGWPSAVSDLEGVGERFVISPYVTKAALELNLKVGDRLLLQGTARSFLNTSSNITIIEELVRRGVEVRRQPRVHAKVYMREFKGGAVGWLGSANLTHNGRSDGSQIEAMSGPFWLDDEFRSRVQQLWVGADPFDIQQVRDEICELERTMMLSGIPEHAMQAFVAVHVTFKAGLGQCTLHSRWLGITTASGSWKGVTFPAVPFLRPEIVSKYRAWKEQAMAKLVKDSGYPLSDGLYLFRASTKSYVEAYLSDLRRLLASEASAQFSDVSALRDDFSRRFNEVLEEFAGRKSFKLLAGQRSKGLSEALVQFDKYIKDKPFELSFSFFVPLLSEEDPKLKKAVEKLSSQTFQSFLFS
jgi:hypothetical protein